VKFLGRRGRSIAHAHTFPKAARGRGGVKGKNISIFYRCNKTFGKV